MKSLISIFLASFLLMGCSSVNAETKTKALPVMQKAISASCVITVENEEERTSKGTGALLKSGYVITAYHILDMNKDGKLTKHELKPTVKFLNIATVYSGSVVAYGEIEKMYKDVAIIKINGTPNIEGVELMSDEEYKRLLVGEEIFTVGKMNMGPMHITTGVLSMNDRRLMRVSASAFFGSSGGGIYHKKTGKLIGIMTIIKFDAQQTRLLIQTPYLVDGQQRGTIYSTNVLKYNVFLPNWTEGVNAIDIRRLCDDKKALYALGNKKKIENMGEIFLVGSLLYILLGILWVRKSCT